MKLWIKIFIFTRQKSWTPFLPLSLHCTDRKFSANVDGFPRWLGNDSLAKILVDTQTDKTQGITTIKMSLISKEMSFEGRMFTCI